MSSIGSYYRYSVFGESHGPAVGVIVEGIPAGARLDEAALSAFLARRAPGKGPLESSRREKDIPEFVSGIRDGVFTGAPVTAIIRNTDARRSDYGDLRYVPRPGHSDLTAEIKYFGCQDASGGGQFSGRLTAPLCVAGGIALQLLAAEGIAVRAKIVSIGGKTGEGMEEALRQAAEEGDSIGAAIECEVTGLPAGLGGPLFGGMEGRIALAVFGIPAVKGIEFGAGFASAGMRGSEFNDAFRVSEDADGSAEGLDAPHLNALRVETATNNCGGLLGGITDGMPLVFRAAFKPTPSIALPQRSVDLRTLEERTLEVRGRHDPCVALRAVPAVEAATAAAVYDALLERKAELAAHRAE